MIKLNLDMTGHELSEAWLGLGILRNDMFVNGEWRWNTKKDWENFAETVDYYSEYVTAKDFEHVVTDMAGAVLENAVVCSEGFIEQNEKLWLEFTWDDTYKVFARNVGLRIIADAAESVNMYDGNSAFDHGVEIIIEQLFDSVVRAMIEYAMAWQSENRAA